MKILICGGRDYWNQAFVDSVLDKIKGRSKTALFIITGGAKGADTLGRNWARKRGVQSEHFPADWNNIDAPGVVVKYNRYGKPYNAVAGLQRNESMLNNEKPNLVVAFPGGSGTDHMVRITKQAIADGMHVRLLDLREFKEAL